MKNYNLLFLLSLIIYLLSAYATAQGMTQVKEQEAQKYKVEINRIQHQLIAGASINSLDLTAYTYIKEVQFLSNEQAQEDVVTAFYTPVNQYDTAIRPLYQNKELKGYVKFLYHNKQYPLQRLFYLVQGCLFIMEVVILVILLYLKRHLIRPFKRLSSLPKELAKGHFKTEMNVEKSRYLSEFFWGISQLRDSLKTSKKRQMELEKEKKQLLLSLSHDIKTPLNLIRLYDKSIIEQMYQSDQERIDAACKIDEKAQEIERYVEKIMKTSREDILDLEVQVGEFYLAELMERSAVIFQEACTIRRMQFSIGTYENCIVKGDLDRTQEVLENLFDNALKYGDGNRMEITFYEEDYCQLIRFYNTGAQIAQQDVNHIFESFYRGANSTGRPGSGLGLYICKEIMHKMDGDIFASIEADGMAFTLVLRL